METFLIPLTEPGLEPACLISKSFDCSVCLVSGPTYCGLLSDKSLLSLLRRRGTPYDSLRFATFARSSAVVQAAEEVLLEEPTLLPSSRIAYLVNRLYPWMEVSAFEIGLHLGTQSHRVLPDEVGGSYYLRAADRRPDRARLEPLQAEGDADIDEAESVLDLLSRDMELSQRKLSKQEQIGLAWTFHASLLADCLKQLYESVGASPGEAVSDVFRLAEDHGDGQCEGAACDLSAGISVVPADVHEVVKHIALVLATGAALERWNALQAGGERANHELVISQLGSVWRHIEVADAPVGEIADLFQDASIAVIEAVRAFDPSRGTAFSQFVGWRIKVALQRSSYDKCRQIRLPVHLWERLVGDGEVGKRSPVIEIEEQIAEVRGEINVGPALVSLDRLRAQSSPAGLPEDDDEDSTDEAFDVASDEPPIDDDLIKGNLHDVVERVLGTLSRREADVLGLRFGLADGRYRTLEAVGGHFGVTRERIRQIEAKALRKLRHPSRSRLLRDWLE